MKKAFGQTVRDLKRGVNKNVLKVPGIEQKVLDATSNETWGPHGSLLADLAQASRNYHECQIIMVVIWKRLSDTGKNWRHVYKALTVLEYMVGHGSERVIDEIKERAYQISALSSFQYIDSRGKDQGNNVRKKSQSLVALVNDKERIAEVREKAAANRDKYRSSAPGGMYKPSGGDRYDYGGRDEERSSYGREYGYRDDDRGSRDGDHYSRGSEDRYGRDGNRDYDNRGRSRSVDNYSRGRSSERERTSVDDGHSSARGSGARADDNSQDGRGRLERKFSEQNISAPPSYEEAVSESRSPVYSERSGGETPQVTAASPPPPQVVAAPKAASPTFVSESPPQKFETFDEFDPRNAFKATPPAYASAPQTVASTSAPPSTNSAEMDLLSSLSDALAIVPVDFTYAESNGQTNAGPAPSFSTSQPSTQTFDDPFGDSPFKAFTSTDTNSTPQQSFGAPFQTTPPPPPAYSSEVSHPDTSQNFGFGDSPGFPQDQFASSQNGIDDILAGILPPAGNNMYEGFNPQPVSTTPNMPGQTPFGQAPNMPFHSGGGFMHQPLHRATSETFLPPPVSVTSQSPYSASSGHQGYGMQPSLSIQRTQSGPVTLQGNNDFMGDFFSQGGTNSLTSSSSHPDLTPLTGAIEIVPQPQKKFEPKSSVWADTLSRGLVNFNISGSKTNPLADIGVDFEAINRREKRLEKPTNTPATSTINMGRAMGSGTGLGRAGANAMRPPTNPMVGSGMPMGVSGYGGMNQNNQPMGAGMNMGGYGQGYPQNLGMVRGPNMPGNNYNPMMGQGGYNPQQTYSGGYR